MPSGSRFETDPCLQRSVACIGHIENLEFFPYAALHLERGYVPGILIGNLENARAPSRRVHELDNRGSAFYLTLYWAQALAEQESDVELAERFGPVAAALAQDEEEILSELNGAQGSQQDVGGYYLPDEDRVTAAMRPSATLNAIIDGV